MPSRILRIYASALARAQNSERVVDFKQNSQDAPRASTSTRPKQREGCQFPAQDSEKVVDSHQNSSTLHAPVLPPTKNSEKVVECAGVSYGSWHLSPIGVKAESRQPTMLLRRLVSCQSLKTSRFRVQAFTISPPLGRRAEPEALK